MVSEPPQLGSTFATLLGPTASDRKAVANLDRATRDMWTAFARNAYVVPTWERLRSEGADTRGHAALDAACAHALIGRRVADHLCDLLDALNRRRLLVAALTARAAIEACALAVYCDERTRALLAETPSGASHMGPLVTFLHRVIGGGRYDWEGSRSSSERQLEMLSAYARASSAKDAPEPPEARRAFNVMTMLGVLDKKVAAAGARLGTPGGEGVVHSTHALLSDFCHPAVGGTVLYLRKESDGEHCLDSQPTDALIRFFFNSAVLLVAPVVEVAISSLIDLRGVASALADGRK
jgi:hypothetical protein